MNLSDISHLVEGWVQQTKLLQSGEVTFIPGLTKGIITRTQNFIIDDSSVSHSIDYMSIDMSINYYKNFRYYDDAINVTSDYVNGETIITRLNEEFDTKLIKITASYVDSSALIFTGTIPGYNFDITKINASTFIPDTSIYGETLVENEAVSLPAFKYPNTAMLGYVLKVTYPSTTGEADQFIQINHVPDSLIYYEPSTGDSSTWLQYEKTVDAGMNGASNATTLSAGDYLDYVQTYNKWEKVGVIKIWLTAPDPESSIIENLITGFYVFNPHEFSVKLDYMTIL
jgi:hypothetical protein